jgi:NAD(P)H-dependent FMN reductase
MKNVTIVLGTAREGRASESVAKALHTAFSEHPAVTATYVDVREHVTVPATVPAWGPGGADSQPTAWKEIVMNSDAFVFVLPEYNHGYPGEWKLLVDSLGPEYTGKAAYVVGVSVGSFAGVRVADHVKPILIELNLIVQKAGLFIGKVSESVAKDGTVTSDALGERINKFVETVATGA